MKIGIFTMKWRVMILLWFINTLARYHWGFQQILHFVCVHKDRGHRILLDSLSAIKSFSENTDVCEWNSSRRAHFGIHQRCRYSEFQGRIPKIWTPVDSFCRWNGSELLRLLSDLNTWVLLMHWASSREANPTRNSSRVLQITSNQRIVLWLIIVQILRHCRIHSILVCVQEANWPDPQISSPGGWHSCRRRRCVRNEIPRRLETGPSHH